MMLPVSREMDVPTFKCGFCAANFGRKFSRRKTFVDFAARAVYPR
jgi:hypothetical protein